MKASKDKKSKDSTNDTSIPKKTLPKEFKWGGFKSHMMATMAKWREVNYLTDATFQCVSFHILCMEITRIVRNFGIIIYQNNFVSVLKIFSTKFITLKMS